MKMLTRDGDQQYLMSLQERLESNGIPALIQGQDTARMIIPRFLLEPSLWIYLDDQFEDAIRLIDDPEHEVTTGIDINAFYQHALSESAQKNALNEGLKHSAIFVGAIMLGVYIFIKILEKISS